MATTWGSNTWGSNSWQSNQNFANPSSATISVTVNSVTAFPEQGWGGKQWGINEWGELSDVTVSLTGQELTPQLGNETAEGILNTGWGRKNWGEESWGIGGSVITPSFVLTTAVQSVTVTNEINVGWGGLSWGDGEWGDLANPDIIQTGIAMTSNTEDVSVIADANVDTTGSEITLVTEGAVGGTSVDLLLTGIQITSNVDGVFAGELVEVPVTSPVNDEWGTESWGQGFWGVGDGVTIFTGSPSFSITANVSLTGVELSTNLGQIEQNTIYEVTSATATTAVNDVFGGEVVEVQVTTASTQPWGETAWGDGQWGQSVGTDISQGGEEVAVPSVEVDVTGQELTSNTGNEAVTADANLTLTGISLDVQLGDEDAFTNVRINVTGQELGPIIIGDYLAGINADVEATGVTITTTTGIISTNAWELVDPGTSPTWTVVDKAA